MSFLRFLGPEVAGLALRLESSGEQMAGASTELAAADGAHLGSTELAAACDDFAGSWQYGIGKLSDQTNGVSQLARDAATAFEDVEQQLANAMREGRR